MKILKFTTFHSLYYMIITKQKDLDYILQKIKDEPVFIIGCSECATLCHTGGEKEVLDMKDTLENKNIQVTGWVILDPACHLLNDKRLLRKYYEEIEIAKKILVLACGNGVQTVSELLNKKEVIPATDTLFLGEIKRLNDFVKNCNLCGDCLQDVFGGLCPISRCPKSMLNGPCGGVIDGKCEVDKELDCIWFLILEKLKERGELNRLKVIVPPKKWSKSGAMRREI